MFMHFGRLLAPHPPPHAQAPGGLGDTWEGRWFRLWHFPPGCPHVKSAVPCTSAVSSCSPFSQAPCSGSGLASCLDAGGPTGPKPSLRVHPPQPSSHRSLDLHHSFAPFACRSSQESTSVLTGLVTCITRQRAGSSLCLLTRISDPAIPSLQDSDSPPRTPSFTP